ncbi:MAG: hypothetical protein IPM02_20020 [Betaproteobacteria bacterium]|nr:hypothetical protein [Betaproteobacteria bacterium]
MLRGGGARLIGINVPARRLRVSRTPVSMQASGPRRRNAAPSAASERSGQVQTAADVLSNPLPLH